MSQLPSEVEAEFLAGNFVVKWTSRCFSEVDPDHALEWLNCVGKESGGIVGITKTPSALSRWALSYNLRSMMSASTLELLGMSSAAEYRHHSEESAARRMKDGDAETRLKSSLQKYCVLPMEDVELVKMTTKEKCPEEVGKALLGAKMTGVQLVQDFAATRMQPARASSSHPFYYPLKKQRCLTFASNKMAVQVKAAPAHSVEVDGRLLQRIMGMYESGRSVDIDDILRHELTSVPTSIALADGTLRTGQKSHLIACLTNDVECPPAIVSAEPTGVVIDAMWLVQVIGRPPGAKTYGDVANAFGTSVRKIGEREGAQRIDVVFDRYDHHSIKSSTRERRQKNQSRQSHVSDVVSAQGHALLTEDTLLPNAEWRQYLSVSSNKSTLASFLGSSLISQSYDFTVVVSGAYERAEEVMSSDPELDLSSMRTGQEEADTRLLLHVANMRQSTVIVYSRDTDVLVLLTYHRERLPPEQIWMRIGSGHEPKYVPVHAVVETVPPNALKGLLAFHAMTGSDTTSFFFKKGKKSAWKIFLKHSTLLHRVGRGTEELSKEAEEDAELFVSRWYGLPDTVSVDKARATLFQQGKHVTSLPPTADALRWHLRRCHYQAAIWEQALELQPVLPPRDGGWRVIDGKLRPVLLSLPPEPSCLARVIRCSCQSPCSKRCGCRKANVPCAAGCRCRCNKK